MVILYGSESWVLLVAMEITVEGTHTGFLIQITLKWALQKADVMWYTPRAEEVQEVPGT